MKIQTLTTGFAGIAALASLSLSAPAMAAEAQACNTEAAAITKAVSASPEDVLKIVAEKVAASPKCGCEIVKAAIEASKADKALVVSIVQTAAAAAPDELPVVLSCAAAVAPQAAAELAAAFSDETEGSGKGARYYGKGTVGKGTVGKDVVETTTTEEDDFTEDFGLLRPGVGGIYLAAPSTGGGGIDDNGDRIRAGRSRITDRIIGSGGERVVTRTVTRVIRVPGGVDVSPDEL